MEAHQKSVTLKLLRLHCYLVEESEYDDVYLMFDGEKIWPLDKKQHPIMMDTTTELNIEINDLIMFRQVDIELWDWDMLKPNDLLGTFSLIIEGKDGRYSTDMVRNERNTTRAKYTLDWELL